MCDANVHAGFHVKNTAMHCRQGLQNSGERGCKKNSTICQIAEDAGSCLSVIGQISSLTSSSPSDMACYCSCI